MTIVTVIGLGLIGGSIAMDLKHQLNVKVLGVDNNVAHQEEALKLGLVHEIVSLAEGQSRSSILLLAVPVDVAEQLLTTVLDNITEDQVVIDMGSTKANICAVVADHQCRGRYVAAHPLAGTEFSGPKAAKRHLFQGKKNIICEQEKSDQDALDTALSVIRSLGMTTYYLDADEHDKHLAYVSHLSHITSFALSKTVLDIEQDEAQIFNLASTGFASTVRLAKSSPSTWAPIFMKNKEHLSVALNNYINQLLTFKAALDDGDSQATESFMKDANQIIKVLN